MIDAAKYEEDAMGCNLAVTAMASALASIQAPRVDEERNHVGNNGKFSTNTSLLSLVVRAQ